MRISLKIKVYYFLIWILMTLAVAVAIYEEIDYASAPGSDYAISIFSFFNRMLHQPFIWLTIFTSWRLQVNRKILKRSKDI